MTIEIDSLYITTDDIIIKIVLQSYWGEFKGVDQYCNTVGYWKANGKYNIDKDSMTLVKKISREINPEYFL